MKSIWSRLILAFLLIAVCLLSASCGDDDDDNNTVTGPDVSALFGIWGESSVTINGSAADLADVLEWTEGTVSGRITLSDDYTYEAVELDASSSVLYRETGTIEIDDNWVILTMTAENGSSVTPEQTFNGTWSVNQSTLTLSQTIGGTTMVLTLNRLVVIG
ncbi:MAG TPA: hypothetical protein PLF13_06680 [candidate division Zixibacteria bacterium]|nr:hypothetical protein [candidate division Zixibacteria bacterium]